MSAQPEPGLPVWVPAGKDRIYIQTPYELKDACKMVTGHKWEPELRCWTFPATAAAAEALFQAMTGRRLSIDAAVAQLLQEAVEARDALVHKTAADADLEEIPGRLPAWLHQKRAYHFAAPRRASLLAMDMGTGKSRTAVSLIDGWGIDVAIIVCPVSVMAVWPNQFATHSERRWRVVVPPNGKTVTLRAAFIARQLDQARAAKEPCAVVVNYEAAWRPVMAELLKTRARKAAVVLDESHRIKAPGGRASVYCAKLARAGEKVLLLTGTPMPHSPMDLYAQFRALDPGVFGTSFNRFRNRYAVMGGFEQRQVIGYQNEDELSTKLGQHSFHVDKREALPDLPPVLHKQRIFALGAKSRRAYATLEADFVLGVGQGTVTAANALVKLLRLQQVTSGYVRDDDGVDHEVGDDKIKALADVLEDVPADEPIVIFARFKHDLARIRALLTERKLRHGEVSGDVKAGHPDYGLNEHSQMREDLDAVVLQLQSGGVGIDLTRAAIGIYYSLDFSLGNYDQTLARLDRPGQQRHVVYIHLIAQDTKDEVVYSALDERRSVVDAVIESSRKEAAA